jgi:hypothetical protein
MGLDRAVNPGGDPLGAVVDMTDGNKRDAILSSDFNQRTWRGIERFIQDTIDPLQEEILHGPIETWAYLFFKLRKADDRVEWFPNGKWATIQRIEQLLEESV